MVKATDYSDFLRAEREAFYAGIRTNKLPLVINDSVRVVSGAFKGREAAVISLESAGPTPTYLIELGDAGGDVVLPLSHLARIDS